ncbi:uncharacterized protein METZ01_LOCUS193434, partial [marine metagenome]
VYDQPTTFVSKTDGLGPFQLLTLNHIFIHVAKAPR